MTYEIELGGRTASVSVHAHPEGGWLVAIDGGPERRVQSGRLGAAEWWLADEGGRRTVGVHVEGETVAAQVRGHGLRGTIVDPRDKALATLGGAVEGAIRTPMPGAVVRVLAKAGDAVHKGQVVIVVEAMKMENELSARRDGHVREIAVAEGQSVEAGRLLLVIA